MKTIRRRDMLKTAAAIVAGGAAGGAAPVQAQGALRTPFTVAPTFIPIAGSGELFPVRRIYSSRSASFSLPSSSCRATSSIPEHRKTWGRW